VADYCLTLSNTGKLTGRVTLFDVLKLIKSLAQKTEAMKDFCFVRNIAIFVER
jgi:hypothetical protein